MSRSSAAKKARRKRRVTARNDRWVPDQVHADLMAVTELDELLTGRGWQFDEEFSTEEFVTWVFPASAAVFDDESIEPVTRVWMTEPGVPHVILVGSSADGIDYRFSVEELSQSLDQIEAYRAGDPPPAA